jgi:hypothetical protein
VRLGVDVNDGIRTLSFPFSLLVFMKGAFCVGGHTRVTCLEGKAEQFLDLEQLDLMAKKDTCSNLNALMQ